MVGEILFGVLGMGGLVGMIFVGGGLSYALPCTEWNAGFAAAPKSGKEARAVATSWTGVGADCDSFTFHSHQVCWDKDTTTAPTTPAGANECATVLGRTTTAKDLWIHRSEMNFGLRLFACQNASCTEFYGDSAGTGATASNDYDDALTERLCFITEGITGDTDTARVLSEADYGSAVLASSALFYPSGWTDADKMLLYWSHKSGGEDVIKARVAGDTGWQEWNTYANWEEVTSGVYDSLVAESKTGTSNPFNTVTHPWAVATESGSTKAIQLFVQAYDSTGAQSEIYTLDSTDETGLDFGLECTDSGGCSDCAYEDMCDYSSATLAVDADADAADEWLDNAAHGRIMWDYVAEGAVDYASDSPGLLFTGQVDGTTCPDLGIPPGPDDMYRAEWDSSASAWDVVDGMPCPTPMGDGNNQHDPGVTPLPDGEFMAFVKIAEAEARVYYFDPGTEVWEDDRDIRICFDSGTDPCGSPATDCTEITTDCVANIDSIVTSSGTPQGGLFFYVAHSGQNPFEGASCTSGLATTTNRGVVYAKGGN